MLPFPLKEPLADKKSADGACDFGFVPAMKWALGVAAPAAVIFDACAVSVPLVWLGTIGIACEKGCMLAGGGGSGGGLGLWLSTAAMLGELDVLRIFAVESLSAMPSMPPRTGLIDDDDGGRRGGGWRGGVGGGGGGGGGDASGRGR